VSKVGLINYGSGNYMSVYNALKYLKINVIEINKKYQLEDVTHIILPGVGSFNSIMDKLKKNDLIDEILNQLKQGKPYLGICVGMQILATLGTEFQKTHGIGYINGNVIKIPAENYNMTLPHIGWNEVEQCNMSPLFLNIENNASFYFVHSYYFVPDNKDCIIANCEYGTKITACVQKENCYGVQFHPEKSQNNGLQLLKNFVSI